MFFAVRNRSNQSRKQGTSNSKDSYDSTSNRKIKKRPRLPQLSPVQLELRMTIENKYSKSKIKCFRYKKNDQKCEIQSDNSAQMQEYKTLRDYRYVDLKEHHKNLTHSQTIEKRYMIRIKNSEIKKKSVNTEIMAQIPQISRNPFKKQPMPRMHRLNESYGFEERKAMSDEKKIREWKKLGFDWRSISKKIRNTSFSPSQIKQQSFYFRKPEKPHRVLASQLSSK